MKLFELFITETPEEDRAIVSLSSAIYGYIQQFDNETTISLGKIGKLFNTPLNVLDNITLQLADTKSFDQAYEQSAGEPVNPNSIGYGFWDPAAETIFLNSAHLKDIKTIISHELRHALDDYKSEFKAGDSESYFSPRKQKHKNADRMTNYNAQRGEINARFLQVLDILARRINMAYKNLPPDQIKSRIMTDFTNLLNKFKISYLFPEKEKSEDYKRLMKRAYDFIQKESSHVEAITGKKATGNW